MDVFDDDTSKPQKSIMQNFESYLKQRSVKDKLKPNKLKQLSSFKSEQSMISKQVSIFEEDLNGNKPESGSKKDIDRQKFVEHLFKKHLIGDVNKNFKLEILKIYFTFIFQKNFYLAHFQLQNFIQNFKHYNGIFHMNYVLLHCRFLESLFLKNMHKDSSFQELDLQKMVTLNQLCGTLEDYLINISDLILKFWNSLLNEKEAQNIYKEGIEISRNLEKIQKVYEKVQNYQEDKKETKIFLQMALFYKCVLFKMDEYNLEISKFKQTLQLIRVATKHQERFLNDRERGILITKMNFKQDMRIKFINKEFRRIVQYNQQECEQLTLSKLMPHLIAINHLNFIRRFMKTGKNFVINNRIIQFLKNKNGYLIPIQMLVIIDLTSLDNMILIVEPIHDNIFFEDKKIPIDSGILIADKELQICDMNEKIHSITNFSYQALQSFYSSNGRYPNLDELFFDINSQSDIQSQFVFKNTTEFYVKPLFHNHDSYKNAQETVEIDKRPKIIVEIQKNQTYRMQIFQMFYPAQNFELKVICLKKSRQSIRYFSPQIDIQFDSWQNDDYDRDKSDVMISRQVEEEIKNDFLLVQKVLDKNESNEISMEMELSSQTSHSSSSGAFSNKFGEHQSRIESNKLPNTLKFILQLVILSFLLVFGTSSVSLFLTYSNMTEAKLGLDMAHLANDRVVAVTRIRLNIRALFNIAQGYQTNQDGPFSDRFTVYANLVKDQIDDLNQMQSQIDQIDNGIGDEVGHCWLYYFEVNNTFTRDLRDISQAVMAYAAYGDDLITKALAQGQQILASDLTFFNIANPEVEPGTLIERQGVFLIQNGNQDFYDHIVKYEEHYSDQIQTSIDKKQEFLSAMSWICIGVIAFSGLAMAPLFGRIQNRILLLMKIFYKIDTELKKFLITEIQKFNQILMASKNQDKIDQTELHSPDNKFKGYKTNNLQEKTNEASLVSQSIQGSLEEIQSDELKSADQIKEEKKKRQKAKQKKLEEQKKQQEQKIYNRGFQNYIQKVKILQSLAIFLTSGIFIAYFLGTYFMLGQFFNEMKTSIDYIKILFNRKSCVENIIHATTETLIYNQGTPYLINDGKDDILEYFSTLCERVENEFQDKIRDQDNSFFKRSYTLLKELEEGQICQNIVGDKELEKRNLVITLEECEAFQNGLIKTGITNIFQTIYLQNLQIRLDYENQIRLNPNGNPLEYNVAKLRLLQPLLDIVEIFLEIPWNNYIEESIYGLFDNINQQKVIYILVYVFFNLLTLVILVTFLCSKFHSLMNLGLFQKLKKEMLLSNKLLYIINFDAIKDEEKQNIMNFLTKY